MATLRDIKRRITSVTNTQQITSAMKMVSAAKLNRAKTAVRAAQPYAAKMRGMVSALHGAMSGEEHPLFTEGEGPSLIVLFTSDRGLCGNFNSNLSRTVLKIMQEGSEAPDAELEIFGRTGNDFFKRRSARIRNAHLHIHANEMPAEIDSLIEEITGKFVAGEWGKVFLAYNYFYNPLKQEPVFAQLLPIPAPETEAAGEAAEVLFEPSRGEILDRLLPAYLRNQGLLAHLNTVAGEHGARMVSMEGATKNAGEMIDRLTLQYNRVRQAAITRELIEIVNGAAAL